MRTGKSTNRAVLIAFVLGVLLATVGRMTFERSAILRLVNPSLAVWLFDGVPLEATYTPTPYRSLQYGSITNRSGGGGGTTVTATITAVDTTTSGIQFLGNNCNDNTSTQAGGSCFQRFTLTNATTVTGTVDVSGGGVGPISQFVVLEYIKQFVNSRQESLVTITTASSGTATITSVNTAKTVLLFAGHSANTNSTSQGLVLCNETLTNATTVTATTVGTTGTTKCGFTALEFK